MKTSLYASYSTRSLIRGGQRTVLALFCIAVGVMAIVGLELAAESMMAAVTGNVRALNQGDVSLQSSTVPVPPSDLSFFDQLKSQGTISAYSPESSGYSIAPGAGGSSHFFQTRIVDPATFPLVGTPRVVKPAHGSLQSLLAQPGGAVLTQSAANTLNLHVGDTFVDRTQANGSLNLTVSGIVANDNFTAAGDVVNVAASSVQPAGGRPVTYKFVAVTTPSSSGADGVATTLRQHFPLSTVQTTADVLKQNKQQIDLISKFLEVVGLLALLIGGVGIVNTMQVLLQRRRMEIAILKTSGYRRRDLYALFGLEAALLGLIGGVIGAVLGVVVSNGLRLLFQRTTALILPARFDPLIIFGGIIIGLATAVMFGLLPIVRAAAARPQEVIRGTSEGSRRGSRLQAIGLILLLSVLFCALAAVILKSVVWAIAAVYGGLILLGLLSLVLSGILWLVAKLPVPERYSVRYVILVTVGLLVALAITAVPSLRGVGIVLDLFALLGYAVVVLPRSWKVSARLALRNIGRTRGRTTTTLLALFIGVFTVGIVLVLGQDLRSVLNKAFTESSEYNLQVSVPAASVPQMNAALASTSGITRHRFSNIAGTAPVSIDGQPVASRVPQGDNGPTSKAQTSIALLSGIQGYDLANGDIPEVTTITAGRNLNASDVNTENVILNDTLHGAPFNLQPGDSIGLSSPDGGVQATVAVVGFYKIGNSGFDINLNQPIFGAQSLALQLAGATPRGAYYLSVPEAQVNNVKNALQRSVPGVFIFDFGDILNLIGNVLNSVVVVFTAIGALALLAGVVIVANAVALAMLERRRELGILKAVGYSSERVLTGVLLEHGSTAGVGGLLGMVMVAVVIALFGQLTKTSLNVGAPITILIIAGVVLLATLTSLAVAWGAVRLRPLEVLRYE